MRHEVVLRATGSETLRTCFDGDCRGTLWGMRRRILPTQSLRCLFRLALLVTPPLRLFFAYQTVVFHLRDHALKDVAHISQNLYGLDLPLLHVLLAGFVVSVALV